ncbi:MAG: hydrogenase nickel incorporation protein HypB [Rhodocyclaceae bacterium]|nr:hydrogenase nickel incorporation protein HypB [Rhodocyclaceae bacterium]
MCTVCGCGQGAPTLEGELPAQGHDPAHEHTHADGTTHSHAHGHQHTHDHTHDHTHAHGHPYTPAGGAVHKHAQPVDPDAAAHRYRPHAPGADLNFGAGAARAHAPGMSQTRLVSIEQDILSKNDAYAAANRKWFDERGIFALNLVSSPGSGKTTLLVKTIERLRGECPIQVVEGDQQTSNDAERIRATGVPALQINTGKGCHLDGDMVAQAILRLAPPERSLFLIENVGNLVCPAAFALGEHHKVAILSVTEGEDKPLKYPDMFAAADVMLLNKCDLLPYLEFDADLAEANARRVNPRLAIFRVSATRGAGMDAWLDWVRAGLAAQRERRAARV